MKNKKDKNKQPQDTMHPRDIAWQMFETTGEIGYYLLYKNLE